jgi:predicted ATPase
VNIRRTKRAYIFVVTGASGVGKTAAVNALNTRRLAGVQCFHFDEIGVPSPAVMERDYGGGEQWQAWARRLGSSGSTC